MTRWKRAGRSHAAMAGPPHAFQRANIRSSAFDRTKYLVAPDQIERVGDRRRRFGPAQRWLDGRLPGRPEAELAQDGARCGIVGEMPAGDAPQTQRVPRHRDDGMARLGRIAAPPGGGGEPVAKVGLAIHFRNANAADDGRGAIGPCKIMADDQHPCIIGCMGTGAKRLCIGQGVGVGDPAQHPGDRFVIDRRGQLGRILRPRRPERQSVGSREHSCSLLGHAAATRL
ncbi:hypothetical protein WR25_04798 [Diploscapter pachys]|uniref:Uncharacterized protein n=1 Tax=Diploscapter pachys TaxID=2018661 RepID=A0A2A2JY96_9BILA|nr:hypothetical protein WR25_04798 [Diploscapter pachys]